MIQISNFEIGPGVQAVKHVFLHNRERIIRRQKASVAEYKRQLGFEFVTNASMCTKSQLQTLASLLQRLKFEVWPWFVIIVKLPIVGRWLWADDFVIVFATDPAATNPDQLFSRGILAFRVFVLSRQAIVEPSQFASVVQRVVIASLLQRRFQRIP